VGLNDCFVGNFRITLLDCISYDRLKNRNSGWIITFVLPEDLRSILSDHDNGIRPRRVENAPGKLLCLACNFRPAGAGHRDRWWLRIVIRNDEI